MKKLAPIFALLAALCGPAAAQVQFPTTLPASTVWGRTGIGAGPGQAIPFGVLFGNLFNGGSAPTAHGVLIGEGTSPLNSVTCASALPLVGNGASVDPSCQALTNAGLAAMVANTVKGSIAGGTPVDLTQAQLTSLCNVVTSGLSGCIPAFPNSQSVFFRGDGTYAALPSFVNRGYLAGNTLSGGGSQTLTITAGQATSDDNTTSMALASTYTKTFAAWAVGSGNGGLDTGAIAANTWYHVYIIERTDTAVVDVLISTNATTPTMPTSYTVKRRIGSIKTDATPNIISFFQNGDTFLWSTMPALDLSSLQASTTAALVTVQTPPGVRTEGIFHIGILNNGAGAQTAGVLLSSPDIADTAPGATSSPLSSLGFNAVAAGGGFTNAQSRVWTNASAQIRHRETTSTSNVLLNLQTIGWVDPRGRFN